MILLANEQHREPSRFDGWIMARPKLTTSVIVGAIAVLCLTVFPQHEHAERAVPTAGAVYVRWGKKTCPSDLGTELVYSGVAGGSWFDHQGGTTSICRPTHNGERTKMESKGTRLTFGELSTIDDPRPQHLPHRLDLMAGFYGHPGVAEFVCVDKHPDVTPGSREANEDGTLFCPVEARCESLPCPSYVDGRELTCVVCTK
ncbi:uncharacterized protein [Branchiostoma lanceolatum]|uniref:uncharacterized protein n=1 Tax=Branchiostoma lanceolatum TaxID=7740 RepID=UPI00345410AE